MRCHEERKRDGGMWREEQGFSALKIVIESQTDRPARRTNTSNPEREQISAVVGELSKRRADAIRYHQDFYLPPVISLSL